MVRGKQDIALLGGMFDDHADYLEAGRLVEVERCSHWVQHDASDELHMEMDAFLLQLAKAE